MLFRVVGLQEVSDSVNFKAAIFHMEDVIYWQLSELSRSVIKTDTIFDDLNKYLATLPISTQAILFEIFRSIHEDLSSSMPLELIAKSVQSKAGVILSHFVFDHVVEFVNRSTDIIIPDSFKEVFTQDLTKNITRGKTYTRKDYIELVAMILILKSLLPVFAHYMYIIQKEVGKEYKEDYVLTIINNSQYDQHRTINKLRRYINDTLIETNSYNLYDLTMKGITIEEHADILLARTIIRKLLVSDLSGFIDGRPKVDSSHNLITYTFKFMTQLKKDSERSPRMQTRSDAGGKQTEDTLSTLEECRLQQNIAIGDIVALEHFIGDAHQLAIRLSDTLSNRTLSEFIESSSVLETEMIYSPQIKIIQILFKKVISPQSLPYLNKKKIVELMALGQALLWENNMRILALLLGAITRESEVSMLATTGSRGRLDPEIAAEVISLFPFNYLPRHSKERKPKPVNPALEDIDKLAKEFNNHIWFSTLPLSKIQEAYQDAHYQEKRLIIPHNIRNEIGKFFIFAERNPLIG